MRWHFQVSTGHGINQKPKRATITKSEISEQTNDKIKISREKAKSGRIKEIALDSGCFWWMKNQSISIRNLI